MKQITVVNLVKTRVCYRCGTNKTLLKKGVYERWYRHRTIPNQFLCHNCYKREYEDSKKYRHNERYAKRRFTFRNRRILFAYNMRTGSCTECDNNIHNGSCNKTDMHHELGYCPIFPWYGLVELCSECHIKKGGYW